MTYVYIIIGILILGFLFLMKSSGKIISQMEEYSKKAIADAKQNHNIDLDLSIESVKKVNEIIQKLHDSGNSNSTETSMMYGGYLGEVTRKINSRGFWVKDHPEMGNDIYPVKFGKNYAFPVIWVKKHLASGEEDNVSHKFNVWNNGNAMSEKA